MPSLETTNIILAVIAAATAGQFLMFLIGALWVAKRVANLEESLTSVVKRFESEHLPQLSQRVNTVVDDLHRVSDRVERVAQEAERATRIVQDILHLVGYEVERATRGVRLAFDVVEGGVRQATRVGAGVKAGLKELFARSSNGQQRQVDEDALARFEAKA